MLQKKPGSLERDIPRGPRSLDEPALPLEKPKAGAENAHAGANDSSAGAAENSAETETSHKNVAGEVAKEAAREAATEPAKEAAKEHAKDAAKDAKVEPQGWDVFLGALIFILVLSGGIVFRYGRLSSK